MAINPQLLAMLLSQAPNLVSAISKGMTNTNTGFEEIPNASNFPNTMEAINRGYDLGILDEQARLDLPFEKMLEYSMGDGMHSPNGTFPSQPLINIPANNMLDNLYWSDSTVGTPPAEASARSMVQNGVFGTPHVEDMALRSGDSDINKLNKLAQLYAQLNAK